MRGIKMKCKIFNTALAGLILSWSCLVNVANAGIIDVIDGFDTFHTTPGTNFLGVSFEGVELINFDFGGTTGVAGVGNADTIVQRLDPAIVPGTPNTAPTIDIELVALQLRSTTPVDFGLGIDHYYMTLDPFNSSIGQMDITFLNPLGGLFDVFINLDFDIRKGSLNGAIALSGILQIESFNTPWGRIFPPDAVLIDGINDNLNGVDNSSDFWLTGSLIRTFPQGVGTLIVEPATVPEPSTLAIFALGMMALASRRFKKQT